MITPTKVFRRQDMPRLPMPSSVCSAGCSLGSNTSCITAPGKTGWLDHGYSSQQWLEHTPSITTVAVSFSVIIAAVSGVSRLGDFPASPCSYRRDDRLCDLLSALHLVRGAFHCGHAADNRCDRFPISRGSPDVSGPGRGEQRRRVNEKVGRRPCDGQSDFLGVLPPAKVFGPFANQLRSGIDLAVFDYCFVNTAVATLLWFKPFATAMALTVVVSESVK